MKSVCILPITENPHLSTICLGRLLVISFFNRFDVQSCDLGNLVQGHSKVQ